MKESSSEGVDARRELSELIERRSMILRWLAGLEAQRGTASERILARVRADYENRLDETLAALSRHLETVRADLDRALERVSATERDLAEAADALEEGRIRHSIGEVPAEEWTERERKLADSLESARDQEEEARGEADRLRELLAKLTEDTELPEAAPAPVAEESVVATFAAADQEDSLETDGFVDTDPTMESWDAVEAPLGAADSEAFLAEIDRALSAPATEAEQPPLAPSERQAPGPDDAEPDTAPKPGLKCGECGYTNDLSAWFCGVCGADVG